MIPTKCFMLLWCGFFFFLVLKTGRKFAYSLTKILLVTPLLPKTAFSSPFPSPLPTSDFFGTPLFSPLTLLTET